MKKSIGLLSALVVSTTFIVNCQKAPDKRRVRPSGGSGSGAQTDIVGEKAKLPTKVCSPEVLDLYKAYYKNKETVKKTAISATSTDAEKEAFRKLGVETLGKCDDIISALKLETNAGCFMDNGVKDMSNALMAENMQGECNALGKKLKNTVELDSSYADAAKEKEKQVADTKKVEDKFIGSEKSFKISEQALNMMYEGNTNLAQFIVDGEIKSSPTTLETALAASKTVCTALGDGIAKDQTLTGTTLKFTSFEKADQSNLSELALDFKGQATMVNFVLHSEGEITTTGALLCLNLDATKLSVEKLDEVLGSAITVAPTKVTTEVTGGTSEAAVVSTPAASSASATASSTAHASDKVAGQPEGSPQQKLLDEALAQSVDKEAEQKAADQKAAQEKTAADKKAADDKAAKEQKAKEEAAAKEEKQAAAPAASATVTVAPVQAASSPAQAEEKVVETEFTALKEKAARLEQEAKDAEAEVKKLEAEKAKADDIAQAKTKARITRESADAAMKELNSAAKAAGFTKYI